MSIATPDSPPSDNARQCRPREPWTSLFLYRLFKWSCVSPMLFWYCRGRVHGFRNIPRSGPFIAVSNHASDFDPPFLATAVGRPVAFMAKEELFEVPGLGRAIRWYGAYPVKRGTSDRKALRMAMEQLENGWGAGLFLDGTRTPDGRIVDPKLGAVWLAAKMQVPLIPVSLWGTHAITPKGQIRPRAVPVTIRIGELIPPPASTDRALLEAVTQQCTAVIHSMLEMGR